MTRGLVSVMMGMFLVVACSGGGGGPNTTSTSLISDDAALPATTATVNLFSFALRTFRQVVPATVVQPVGISQTSFEGLGPALNEFLQAMLLNYIATQSQPNVSASCSGGGSVVTTTTTTPVTGIVVRSVYNNCVTQIDTDNNGVMDASLFRNGAAQFSMSNTLLDYASELTTRVTRLSDNVVLWEETNTGVNVHASLISRRDCGGNPYFATGSLQIVGTRSVKVDSNGNDVWDIDQEVAFNNFYIGVIDTTINILNCQVTAGTLVRITELDSPVTITDNNQSMRLWTSTISPDTPTRRFSASWSANGSGEALVIVGDYSIGAPCGRKMYSISTPTPIQLPVARACATSGTLQAELGGNATFYFTGAGEVQVDRGSNGSIDALLSSCSSALVCR